MFLDLDIVQEAYFGKTKGAKKLPLLIGEGRKKYLGQGYGVKGNYSNKEFEKIGNCLAEMFGFKTVDFLVIPDVNANAFTFPVSYSLSHLVDGTTTRQTVKKTPEGYRFTENNLTTAVRVTSGMWNNEAYTDEEVTAIVLHEIGHNFQHILNTGLDSLGTVVALQKFINLIASKGQTLSSMLFADATLTPALRNGIKKLGLNPAASVMSNFMGLLKNCAAYLLAVANMATLGTIETIGSGINALGINPATLKNNKGAIPIVLANLLGRLAGSLPSKGAEFLSDEFAATYGYGPELASALGKMELNPDGIGNELDASFKKSFPTLANVHFILQIPANYIFMALGSHPVFPKRTVNMVKELENELKKSDLSPKTKKEIQKDIDTLKEVVDETLDMYNKNERSMRDPNNVKKALYKKLVDYDKNPKNFFTSFFGSVDDPKLENGMNLDNYEANPVLEVADILW